MELKPGLRLRSTVSDAEVVVIRSPAGQVALTCGGQPMVDPADADPSPSGTPEGELVLGKRYVDGAGSLEVLCTRAGAGVLAVEGAPLDLKTAKPLPSSD